MPFFLIYLSSWLGISGGIYGLFSKAGEAVKDDSKKAVSKWLQNIELEKEAPNWPATFASLFDRVFTERHFSWKCFRRSSIASVIGVIIMTLIYIVINKGLGNILFVEKELTLPAEIVLYITIALFSFLFNVFPDYFSLLESRYIVQKMCNTGSGIRWCFFIIVDFCITLIIFLLFFVVVSLIFGLFSKSVADIGLGKYILDGISRSFKSLELSGRKGIFGIYFYTTFFTSIWIWLYAGSGILIKFIVRGSKFLSFFRKHLNIEEKPFRSMGFVIIIFISFAYLIGGVIMLIT